MTYTQICPRCQHPNQCGYSENPTVQGCWCTKLKPPKRLREAIKEEWGTTSCLCNKCLGELIEGDKTLNPEIKN